MQTLHFRRNIASAMKPHSKDLTHCPDLPHVVVVGGGFAGLQFIRHLNDKKFRVTLIDRLNHHQFQPLFYQVATSQVEPSSISFPFRKILQHRRNLRIRMAEVSRIDTEGRIVFTNIGDIHYDHLVLASGCSTNFYGNTQIEKHAFTLKTTYEAITIRNAILENFERVVSLEGSERDALLSIVIVGAGPTGVELSGAFAEIKKFILPKDFPDIDFSALRIILLEGSQNTLGSMSPVSQKTSRTYLEKLGVELFTGVFVTDYDGLNVKLSSGDSLLSRNLIWAAGVSGNIVEGIAPELVTGNRRIRVDRHCRVQGNHGLYAIGDIAYMETPRYPRGHPQVANVAIHQARMLAYNMNHDFTEAKLRPYEYRNMGSMATIGRNKAVVDLPFMRFRGYIAWLVWMFLHLMLILSVRNKLIIFLNWALNYLSKDSSLRLILKSQSIKDR
jgi:NADH:ubiquinone reductase (H+-translocating)